MLQEDTGTYTAKFKKMRLCHSKTSQFLILHGVVANNPWSVLLAFVQVSGCAKELDKASGGSNAHAQDENSHPCQDQETVEDVTLRTTDQLNQQASVLGSDLPNSLICTLYIYI